MECLEKYHCEKLLLTNMLKEKKEKGPTAFICYLAWFC